MKLDRFRDYYTTVKPHPGDQARTPTNASDAVPDSRNLSGVGDGVRLHAEAGSLVPRGEAGVQQRSGQGREA